MRLKLPRPWLRRVSEESGPQARSADGLQPQTEIGAMLRHRREELGLSLRELANETRITTPVIEALERGWSERLPERTYLASMLPQLERRLDLPQGCLEPVLPPRAAVRQMRSGGLRRFTPGSIDVFTTWQGSVVYAVVIVLSLWALNRQQQDLVMRNTQTLEPVALIFGSLGKLIHRPAPTLICRPASLEQAERRDLLQWLEADGGAVNRTSGVLQVILTTPRQLQISSGGGDRLKFKGSTGTLTLQLLPPVELVIEPALAPEARCSGMAHPNSRMASGRVFTGWRLHPAELRHRPTSVPRQPRALHNL